MPAAFSIRGVGLPGSRSADRNSSAKLFLSGNYAERKFFKTCDNYKTNSLIIYLLNY
jgi:hypothetical protein